MDYAKIEKEALQELQTLIVPYEEAALFNTKKVIEAFRKHKVSDYYLKPSTGYAYSDVGRDTLDLIYADIFKAEKALVRSQFVSG
ncbi:MAG TPA: methionine gamma-lyase family protein, partial [Candidatus Avacidaminococcus intestinavium]|nr:methionine gamma-lyase family protein [Candidatus Avacidaminococcus intestinavium]